MVWITVNDIAEYYPVLGKCVPALQLDSALASTRIDHLSNLHVQSRASTLRLSGISCVIGMTTRDPDVIEQLIERGMNIAAMKITGKQEYDQETLQNIRTAVASYNKKMGVCCSLAIACNTLGPQIRVQFPLGGSSIEMTLYDGDIIRVTADADYVIRENPKDTLYISYDSLYKHIKPGDDILIRTRTIILRCIGIEDKFVICRVVRGGDVRSNFTVYLPGIPINLPALKEKDKMAIRFAIENDLDIVYASYIRTAAAVEEIRQVLGPEGKNIKIISQIENQDGINNIDEILKVSDGILVSRCDLHQEIDEEELIIAQKFIISKCNAAGKPVSCTLQMMRSSVNFPKEYAAETSDAANCILNGADGVFIYRETTIGDNPILTVQKVAAICKQAEAAVWQKQLVSDLSQNITPPAINIHAVAISAVQISLQLLASAIIVISTSMKSAELMVQYRPKCPVIAVTRSARNARQAHLFRGILPLVFKSQRAVDWGKDVQDRVYYGINFGRKRGFVRPGDPVVVMTQSKHGAGFADKMRIMYTTRKISSGTECVC